MHIKTRKHVQQRRHLNWALEVRKGQGWVVWVEETVSISVVKAGMNSKIHLRSHGIKVGSYLTGISLHSHPGDLE